MTFRLFSKLLFISLFIISLIISGVFFSISMLKEEAIKTHLKLVQLYSNIFVDNFSRTINGMDLLVHNVTSYLNFEKNSSSLDEILLELLKHNPEIRSINILDENNKIINSSNNLNKNLNIKLDSFYPKLQFKSDIFLVGEILEGRDFIDAREIKYDSNRLDINFFPILKEINFQNKNYKVLIAVNGDFLIHRYNEFVNIEHCYIDLIRLDGKVLISNDFTQKNKLMINDEEIFKTIKEKNSFSDIINFNNEKNIISFTKTLNSPFGVIVRLNYEKSLQSWQEKSYIFLFIIFTLLILSIFLVLSLLYIYNKKKNKELLLHKKFKILFEQSNFFALIVNSKGKILEINQSFSSLLSNENLIDNEKKIWEYSCWMEEEKKWLKNIIENYDEQNKVQKELSLVDSNGNKKVIELILSSFEIENDKEEYVAIALDITNKKEGEHKLKQAYKVFENAHDGIIITDANVNIINVNKAFERNTGYLLNEVIGQNPKLLKSDIQDLSFYKNMWEDLIFNNYWEGEIINKRKDGKLYTEILKISTVYNEEKKLVNYIAIFSDISLQKEQEILIKEKEKILYQQSKMAAMGEMIGNIAHQWRQPLSVISVSASGIKLYQEEGLYTKEDLKDFIEAILHSTKYLSDTIDDFRNFYKDDLEKSDFEVKKSIDKTINLLNIEFIKEEIEVIYLSESNLFIHGIENQFLQVIMNILNNAKDVLVEKDIKNRYIFIDLYKKDDKTYIEIQDNAGGVNEDIIEHIFEPYFTTKHKSLGTGIGLYMSEEIVTKQLNGKLFVYNKSINYKSIDYFGACFRIII